MKSFFDLSYSEIIELTDSDVSKYIIKERILNGVDGIEHPGEKPQVQSDFPVYSVNYYLNFKDRTAANAVVDLLNSLSDYMVEYRHYHGIQTLKTRRVRDTFAVDMNHWALEENVESLKEQLELYEQNKKLWDDKKDEIESITVSIQRAYRTCLQIEREANRLASKFVEYLDLSQNAEKASEYLRKNLFMLDVQEYRLKQLNSEYCTDRSMTDEAFAERVREIIRGEHGTENEE